MLGFCHCVTLASLLVSGKFSSLGCFKFKSVGCCGLEMGPFVILGICRKSNVRDFNLTGYETKRMAVASLMVFVYAPC